MFVLPIFVVPKDSGKGLRLIVDLRKLNAFLRKRKMSLPTLNKNRIEYNDILGFWTYDLTSAYQHVEVAKEHQKYFGIQWQGQTFLLTVCSYGCSTIPEAIEAVASLPLRMLNTYGFMPDMDSVEKWKDLAAGKISLPPPGRRLLVSTD